jgi:brefeldin A-inhibited guanine nucleotide-exchange protein
MEDTIVLSNLSTNIFVIKALQNLFTDKESTKQPELRRACQDALKLIRKETDEPIVTATLESIISLSEISPKATDELIIMPLKLACQSGNPRLCSIALDCLQKLMAYGGEGAIRPLFSQLQEEATEEDITDEHSISYPSMPMTLRISTMQLMNIICDCFINEHTDENVQLHVIKALLTSISVEHCQIHGAALLKAIRTIYNIVLLTKSSVNQQTAKGTLSQLIQTIFQRMKEHYVFSKPSSYETLASSHITSTESLDDDTLAELDSFGLDIMFQDTLSEDKLEIGLPSIDDKSLGLPAEKESVISNVSRKKTKKNLLLISMNIIYIFFLEL